MCECKNQRPTGKQTTEKLWGIGAGKPTSDTWPPLSKPAPFTDAETAVLTRIVKDSISELRRERAKPKPVLSAAQVATIRRIVQDARKPARESYRITGADSGRYAERITKIRTDNPRLHGEIVHIGGMKCQLVDGRMVCK